MIFTNLDHKKNNMEETIEALRIEIIDLVTLRDTVLNEIRDQRRGKQEVFIEARTLSDDVYTLETNLNATLQALNDSSAHFYSLTDKQRSRIEELNRDITNRLSELATQE